MAQTLPPGATVYAKRPLDAITNLDTYLGRELGIIERAVRDSRLRRQRRVTTDLTLTDQDDIVYADATSAALTTTLPEARGFWGYEFNVKKIDASANVVTVSAPVNIDGATTYALAMQYAGVTVVSDGEQWWVK